MFSQKDYMDLQRKLRKATEENPIVSGVYCLCIKGNHRWFKATARPLWEGEGQDGISGIIGKFVDVHEEQLKLDKLKRNAERDGI